jgi:hypothetical protein
MNIAKFHELVNSMEKTAAYFGNPVPGNAYRLSGWPTVSRGPLVVFFLGWERIPGATNFKAVFLVGEKIERHLPFNFSTLDDNFSLEPVVDNEE